MGLSLYDEMQEGTLSSADYAQMVTLCRGCALVEACERWLASSTPGAGEPPPGCPNAERLHALKQRH